MRQPSGRDRDKGVTTDTENNGGVDVAKECEFHDLRFMDSRRLQAIGLTEC